MKRLLPLALALLALAPPPARSQAVADASRMLDVVTWMAQNPDGSPISRFCFEPRMDAIGAALADSLAAALAPAGSRASAALWPFPAPTPILCDTCDSCPRWSTTVPYRTTFNNVVGHLAGTRPGQGKILITAHYDAIGCRTIGGWQAWTDPAPGADDNASGCAAVLELARILSSEASCPFDLEFVMFDGEELVLKGSAALAQAEADAGDNILGVLNMDMIAYNTSVDSLVLMTNRSSVYWADYLLQTQTMHPVPDFHLVTDIEAINFSDHASYWEHGYPAILLIENVHISLHNPQYHRITDTAATISRSGRMMARGADVFLNGIRRLRDNAAGPPQLVLYDDDVLNLINGTLGIPDARPGDSLELKVGLFNIGGDLGAAETVPVRVYRVTDAGSRTLISDQMLSGPLETGGHGTVSTHLKVGDNEAGTMQFDIEAGSGSLQSTVRHVVPVRGDAVRLVHHYIAPNPVRDIDRAWISYELSGEASIRLTVFDFHGHQIGRESLIYQGGRPDPNSGMSVGLNRVPLRDVVGSFDMAPGIYHYRIEVIPVAGSQFVDVGSFAVVR